MMLRQAAAMVRLLLLLLAPTVDVADAWWYCWSVLMASMGWSEHLTQAAAKALARPFLRPSDQAEAEAGVVDDDAADAGVGVAVVADTDTNAPPLGIAFVLALALGLAYLKLFCASSDRMLCFLLLLWFLLLLL
jgi:hypothetical protein